MFLGSPFVWGGGSEWCTGAFCFIHLLFDWGSVTCWVFSFLTH